MGCGNLPFLGCCGKRIPPLKPGAFYIYVNAANHGRIPKYYYAYDTARRTRTRFLRMRWTATYSGFPANIDTTGLPSNGTEFGEFTIDSITGATSATWGTTLTGPVYPITGGLTPTSGIPINLLSFGSRINPYWTGKQTPLVQSPFSNSGVTQDYGYTLDGFIHAYTWLGTVTIHEDWDQPWGDSDMDGVLDGLLSLCDFDSFPDNSNPSTIAISTWSSTIGYVPPPLNPCVPGASTLERIRYVGSYRYIPGWTVFSNLFYEKTRTLLSKQTTSTGRTCIRESNGAFPNTPPIFTTLDCSNYCIIEPPPFVYDTGFPDDLPTGPATDPYVINRVFYANMTTPNATCP